MTSIQALNNQADFQRTLPPSKQFISTTLIGLAAGVGYLGLSTWTGSAIAASSVLTLGSKTWNWKNSPAYVLSENTRQLNEQNLANEIDQLYEALTCCGLQGSNRRTAERRYMALVHVAECSMPGTQALQQLQIISNVLGRPTDRPSLDAISYDMDRLFEEMAQQGLKNKQPFQARWNALHDLLTPLNDVQMRRYLPEYIKLVALQNILLADETTLRSSPEFASYQAVRISYEIMQAGTLSSEAILRCVECATNCSRNEGNDEGAQGAMIQAFNKKAFAALQRAQTSSPPSAEPVNTAQTVAGASVSPALELAAEQAAEYMLQGFDMETAMRMALGMGNAPAVTTSSTLPRPQPRQHILSADEERAAALTEQFRRQGYNEITAMNMAWEQIDRANVLAHRNIPQAAATTAIDQGIGFRRRHNAEALETLVNAIFPVRAGGRPISSDLFQMVGRRFPRAREILRGLDDALFERPTAAVFGRPAAPDVTRLNGDAIRAAQGLLLSDRAKRTSPPAPQNEELPPDLERISLPELLNHYERLFPADAYGSRELERRHVEKEIAFAQNAIVVDAHTNVAYTTGTQLGLRLLINELRNPEIPDDLKRGAILSVVSWSVENFGCHPRRYEDLYTQIDNLRSGGRSLADRIIFWNATDKEEIISRCCLSNGVGLAVLVHHKNKARRDIGAAWGLKQDPVSISDPYIATFATSSSARQFNSYLEQNWSSAYMIQQTKDRVSNNAEKRALFNNEVQRLAGLDLLPDNWAETFYEADRTNPSHRNPTYLGVAHVLRANGFLENSR